jgi:NAD(P)-dependent dehydrogenase (short-subunit alcohol dehydrogenase family)
MTKELSESTVLVTGATAGIGRSVAEKLAAAGATVVVHGRDAARGAATVDAITAAGGTARFVAADLASPDDVARLADEAGDVDVLINNAGIYEFAPSEGVDLDSFDRQFAVNTRAPLQLVAALAPKMADRGFGTIVNVTTLAARQGLAAAGIYGASKAALELLSDSWANEFGPRGVRVNTVSPGATKTPGTSGMPDMLEALAGLTIAGRTADADEIANAIVWLASPASSYVHATTLSVDGGLVTGVREPAAVAA